MKKKETIRREKYNANEISLAANLLLGKSNCAMKSKVLMYTNRTQIQDRRTWRRKSETTNKNRDCWKGERQEKEM